MYGALQTKPFVYTYIQDRVEIVGGPSCREGIEIDTHKCSDDRIPVVERRGGGGTVVLAPGMVVTVIVGERPGTASAIGIFNTIHGCMISLLSDTGICGVTRSGISDLSIDNRKILGSSLYMGNRPRLYYYQSSLLVDPDLRLMEQYLKYPPREPDYRHGRRHRDFCASLAGMGFSVTAEKVREIFDTRLARGLAHATIESGSRR